ncbi:hypothetical protein THIOSC15_2520008 [uncultured Thiomicrorhabdus sp.]
MFQNTFLDKLIFLSEPYQAAKDLRVFGAQLSIKDTSKILGIAERTIKAYECPTNPPKIPTTYFISLRFLSGDLSYFHGWDNCRIHPSNNRLRIPQDKYSDYSPDSLTIKSTEISRYAADLVREAEERKDEQIKFLTHLLDKYRDKRVFKEKESSKIIYLDHYR